MALTSPVEDTPDQAAVRATTRALLARWLPPERALELDAGAGFDPEVWRALGEAGLLGIGADPEVGGSGGTAADALAVTEEIARVLPGLAVAHVLTGMAMRTLSDPSCGPCSSLLPAVAAGTTVLSYGMSEPGGGTDLLRLRTTAREVGGAWELNGQKTWITMGTEADVILVVARTDPSEDGRLSRGLSVIAVPAAQPGVVRRRVHLAGMRAGMTSEIFLDRAHAPLENVVGVRGRAMSILGRTLDIERLLSAAISLGIAGAALDLQIQYARERQAFERPIGAFQAVQHPIADSASEVMAVRTMLQLVAREMDSGQNAMSLAAMAKLYAGETAARVVDRAMRTMGAMGLAVEHPMQMYFRDARLALFSPMSNEMARNTIGEALGLPRSY